LISNILRSSPVPLARRARLDGSSHRLVQRQDVESGARFEMLCASEFDSRPLSAMRRVMSRIIAAAHRIDSAAIFHTGLSTRHLVSTEQSRDAVAPRGSSPRPVAAAKLSACATGFVKGRCNVPTSRQAIEHDS
jgi:hypothetical protein